jgi:hypothetical protein
MHIESAGINNEIGGLSHVSQNLSLAPNAVNESLTGLQRMRSTVALEPLHENCVICFQEQDTKINSARLPKVIEACSKRLEESTGANIHYNCKSGNLGALQDSTHHLFQEHWRQVVDYEPALILKRPGRSRTSCSGHTRHHKDL